MKISYRSIAPHKIQDGDSDFDSFLYQDGDIIFSSDIKVAYFQIPVHPQSKHCWWFALKGSFSVQGYILLSFTSQVFIKVFMLV